MSRPAFNLKRLTIITLLLCVALVSWQWGKIRQERAHAERVQAGNQVLTACQAYAKDHEGRFPTSLQDLVLKGKLDDASYQALLKLGDWDYQGAKHQSSDDDFLLATLHVLPRQSVDGKEFWLGVWSKKGVEIPSAPAP